MDHRARWAGPLWEGGNVVFEDDVVDLVNQDAAEEGGDLIPWVGFGLRVDLNDERGSYGRKQTGLTQCSTSVQQKLRWDPRRSGSCSNARHIS